MGLVPLYPWSSRPFSPRELDHLIPTDTALPWRDRLGASARNFHGIRYDFIRPSSSARYNTGFAYGSNDGPIWAGRGLTSAIQAGFSARWGPGSLTIAPMAFRAENRAFFIMPTGRTGAGAFANAIWGGVDLPQRFGAGAYQRVDPGQSTLRIDLPIIVGLAGPATLATLTKFGLRCGIGNSMRALRGQIGRFGRLLTDTGPDDVMRGLYAAPPTATASIAGFHLFPFGGLRKSANWLRDFDRDALAVSAR